MGKRLTNANKALKILTCVNELFYKQNNTDKQAWGFLSKQDFILGEWDHKTFVCANKIFILGQCDEFLGPINKILCNRERNFVRIRY